MKIDEAFQEMFPKNYNWPEICQLGYAQFLVKKSSQLSLSRQENSKFSPTLQTFQIIDSSEEFRRAIKFVESTKKPKISVKLEN